MTSTNESVSAQQLAAPDAEQLFLHHYDQQHAVQAAQVASSQDQSSMQHADQEPSNSDNTNTSKDGKRNGHGKTLLFYNSEGLRITVLLGTRTIKYLHFIFFAASLL